MTHAKRRAAPRKDYVLRLYIAGLTSRSTQAIEGVRRICDEHLKDRYELEVIDIFQLPALAKGEQIVATPTLVQLLPVPLHRQSLESCSFRTRPPGEER